MCFEPPLELLGQLIRNRKKLRSIEDRVPDFCHQLESLRNAELANLGDVCDETIVPPSAFRRCSYSTLRESPTRLVTPSRSIHSSRGMAILRERPKYSLNWPTSIVSPARTLMRSRAATSASR